MNALPRTLAVATLVLLVSAATGQEEPRKYDLSVLPELGTAATAGEIRTTVSSKTESQSMRVEGPDGKVLQESDEVETVSAEWVTRFDEVDDEGEPKRKRVHVRAWQIEKAGKKTSDLTGYNIDVTGLLWSVVEDVRLSKAAKAWVEKELLPKPRAKSARREMFNESMLPDGPVAVGESWDIDPADFAKVLGGDEELPFDLDEENATGTGTLVKVAGEGTSPIVYLEFVITAPLEKMGTGRQTLSLEEGSALSMSVSLDGPLRGAAPAHMDAKAQVKATASTNGVKISFDMQMAETKSQEVGGELPEPVEEEPEDEELEDDEDE